MPRYNVKCPNGKWRVFSSIVDGFISDEMTDEEFVEWRLNEYGNTGGSVESTWRFIHTGKGANSMDYNEAVEKIEMRQRYENESLEQQLKR